MEGDNLSDKMNIPVEELSIETKEMLKEAVKVMKSNYKDSSEESLDLNRLEEKLKRIRIQYEKELQAYNNKQISSNDFSEISKQYDFDTTELLLEITTRKRKLESESYMNQRINCFFLLLKFPPNTPSIEIDVDDETKILTVENVYQTFLNTLLKEIEVDLKFQQDIIRLKLKFNSNKNHVVDKNHKFYLSRMDTLKASDELYNIQEDLKTVLNTSADVTKYDYKKIKVEDFINYNCEKIYQDVFINQNEKRKK